MTRQNNQQKISIKPQVIRAAQISIPIVILARLLQGFDVTLGHWMLLPGNIVNLLIFGVHGTWKGVLCEFVTLVPSAIAWFIFILAILCLIKQSKDKQ